MEERYVIEQTRDIDEFEQQLLCNATREQQRDGHTRGKWNRLVQLYIRQKAILEEYPFPEALEEERTNLEDDDSVIPSIKHITQNIDLAEYEHFYRWGLKRIGIPNYRVIYTVENFWKVVLLHHFVKEYNGAIRAEDIEQAIERYAEYLITY